MTDIENLPQTSKSLKDFEKTLEKFQVALQNKKNAILQQRQSYKHNMAEKTKQIETLKTTVSNTLIKITNVAQKIDTVLKEDGSSNNNN